MLGYEFPGSGNSESTACSNDYCRRCDNVLPGGNSGTYIECSKFLLMEHRSYVAGNNSECIRQLLSNSNECQRMFSYEFSYQRDSKSITGSDDYTRWTDDILYRRLSSADSKRRKFMAVEHGSYVAGNYSKRNRKLYSNGNECKRMLSCECCDSSNGKSGAAGNDYFRRSGDVLPGRISGADSKCRHFIFVEHGSYDTGNYSKCDRQLLSRGNVFGRMLGYEFSGSGNSKPITGSDDHSRRSDDILYRWQRGAHSECRQLMAVEHRSGDAGDYSNSNRQLLSNSD